MTNDQPEKAFETVLAIPAKTGVPSNLVRLAQALTESVPALATDDLTHCIANAPAKSSFLSALGMQVHKWDAAADDHEWAAGTQRSTPERRKVTCELLGIDAMGEAALLQKRPIYHDSTIVITAPWTPWYTAERAHQHEYYWPRYRDYLLTVKGWPEDSITALDLATGGVLERLTDPTRPTAYQAKGLVVGYVQSGKTANFTGVIAKAIDAGYRLIVVMTGTIEMLRSQTQRRLDMEMVGRQNILADLTTGQAITHKDIDYQDDEAWLTEQFIDLGGDDLPTEIVRLTQHKKDYQKQFKTLKIDRTEPSKPLYDPVNLFHSHARLAVVKKNGRVLQKLVQDIEANNKAFSQIPVLIIDDESDQASVNTVDPEQVRAAKEEGKDIEKRRTINRLIAQMLTLMPRAQYVGYTATPFANVLVDPSDEQDIFPKDFVLGLDRPPHYMGVEDFHDLVEGTGEPTFATSNAMAFVRALEADDSDAAAQDRELATAIDMFVLTGAVKLHRAALKSGLVFRHHTMLVHNSVMKDDHRVVAERVRALWSAAEFTKPSGKSRLRDLYERDLLPVSAVRLETGGPPLPPFEEVAPFIGQAISRITASQHNPVLVVNSDKDVQAQQQALDFDRQETWRILVGGAKLSRGFTVEGLTVTYFRRAINMSDSLTQMGRWFGFRPGYRDLVRLFIARKASFGGKQVDIYQAFENVARDEAAFRNQLRQYAELDGGKPRIKPSQIPPLVSQHLPWLRPTAKNKMFNAVIDEQSEQPFTASGYANHVDELKASLHVWRGILAAAGTQVEFGNGYRAFVGVVAADAAIRAMESTRYLHFYRDGSVLPKTAFYQRLVEEGALKDFLVVVPQPATAESAKVSGVGVRAVVERNRRKGRGEHFGEMTDPKHKPPLEHFINPTLPRPKVLLEWEAAQRGALLIYLAKESTPTYRTSPPPTIGDSDPEYGLVVAFSAYVPQPALSKEPVVIRFKVRDPSRKEDPVIDAPSGGPAD